LKPSSPEDFQNFLRAEGLTFACAESCTGGLVAHRMTALAGSSDVFWGGAVTYSNEAKTQFLGVDAGLIADHGAVSAPVAVAMVEGLVAASGVALAVSITGVAGPTGGTAEKPVGTVWFGVAATREGRAASVAVKAHLRGTRNEIQDQAAVWALVFAAQWWRSTMDLDSLRALTDNGGKSVVADFQPPTPFPPPVS
jgi:nicotinamide-nucleotide amidase